MMTTPLVEYRRLYVRVLGASNLKLGGGGTITVLVTTGSTKECRAESEPVPATAAPTWHLETALDVPARGRAPNFGGVDQGVVQFSVHRRHFLSTELLGIAVVTLTKIHGAQ